jgi:hypothetical protein
VDKAEITTRPSLHRQHPRLVEVLGRKAYRKSTKRLIMADSGASHDQSVEAVEGRITASGISPASIIWLAYPDGAFPAAGTSKSNKIEHRMFSFITPNWRARSLVSDQTIIDLVASTRTKTGLEIKAKLTPRTHPSGVEISAAEMANAQPEIRSISRRRELLLPAPMIASLNRLLMCGSYAHWSTDWSRIHPIDLVVVIVAPFPIGFMVSVVTCFPLDVVTMSFVLPPGVVRSFAWPPCIHSPVFGASYCKELKGQHCNNRDPA